MTALQLASTPDQMHSRTQLAKDIKELMVDWTGNTLSLGTKLAKAKETFPENPKRPGEYPGFVRWAKATTGLSEAQINQLILAHKRFGHRSVSARLGQQVMFLLARDNVPEAARIEALDRAERGEHVTAPDARKIVRAHTLPTAKEANKRAKEEGRPIFARDGNIYFGTDAMRAKEGEDRRTMVYGVRKALDTLGSINLTGREFLAYALPHQLWDKEESKIIKSALRWLTMLDTAWDER